jgi:hypothetical protein
VRVLWLVPQIGAHTAELLEAPVMLVVSVLAARWVVRRRAVPPAPAARLGMGAVGLGLVLLAELAVVVGLRGMSLDAYLASRDPVAGVVYLALLTIFALAPLVVARG